MKRMLLNSTSVDGDGNLFLQWRKQFSEDGETWENLDFHRTMITVGGDIDAQIAAVNAHVKEMGFLDGVDSKSVDSIKAHAVVAWKDKLENA